MLYVIEMLQSCPLSANILLFNLHKLKRKYIKKYDFDSFTTTLLTPMNMKSSYIAKGSFTGKNKPQSNVGQDITTRVLSRFFD